MVRQIIEGTGEPYNENFEPSILLVSFTFSSSSSSSSVNFLLKIQYNIHAINSERDVRKGLVAGVAAGESLFSFFFGVCVSVFPFSKYCYCCVSVFIFLSMALSDNDLKLIIR